MKYKSASDFSHDSVASIGVLMVNLGTPDAPDRASVRRYLKEFLWDPRVVEMSRPLWWLVLNLLVLNTRPAKSARAYAGVWSEQGSPLLEYSRAQCRALDAELGKTAGAGVHVELAMRYGTPSIPAALEALRKKGARRILVLPMYPQYSATTTASVFDAVAEEIRRWRWIPELRFVNQYHDDMGYVAALAASVRAFQALNGRPDLLLMSFHGIPKDYFEQGDPYHCHCHKTARLLAERLGLDPSAYKVTFQSRLGPRQWLQPYTDETLGSLPGIGVRNVQVVCPGFSADCLETLEEIAVENRDVFLEAGGQTYRYIPCLNDDPGHIAALAALVRKHLLGWEHSETDPATLARAREMGAER